MWSVARMQPVTQPPSHVTPYLYHPLRPAPLVLQFLVGSASCSPPRAPVPSAPPDIREAVLQLTVYPAQPGNWPRAPDYHRTPYTKHTLLSALTNRE